MRRRRYRRNPDGESRGGSMLPWLVVGGAVFFFATRPGGLSALFPTSTGFPLGQPAVNPLGGYANGIYYPPGVPIPTFGQQLGQNAITAGITAAGATLSEAIRSWFTGPSASTVNTGSGNPSAAVANAVNPNPSPGLSIGDTSVGSAPVQGTSLWDVFAGEGRTVEEELAYADALAQQSYADAASQGQFVQDVHAWVDGFVGA